MTDGPRASFIGLLGYLLLGVVFGVTLIQSEVVSWFRIQEMFRFDAFHMYGIILSAIATARLSMIALKSFRVRTLEGEAIHVPGKEMNRGHRYWLGGTLFGLGWAVTGACPGPMVALVGAGVYPFVIVIVSALAGTWAYGHLRPHLPH